MLQLSRICTAFLFTFAINAPASANLIFSSGFEDLPSATLCQTASAMTELTNNLDGIFFRHQDTINPAGDTDYVSFTLGAEGWIHVWAYAVEDQINDPDLVDTFITMFSADGNLQLARNNDRGFRSDSQIMYRSSPGNTHCIRVEDASTALGKPPVGGPGFDYAIDVVPVDFELYDYYNQDMGDNNSTASAQTGLSFASDENFQRYAAIMGSFDSLSDVDVYELVTPFNAKRMEIKFTPNGVNGDGSTTPLGFVDVYAADGTTLIGRMDYTKNTRGLSLPVSAESTYFLYVNTPPGPLGSNPFYAFEWLTTDADNQQETDNTANNAAAGAEVATPVGSSHFIGGNLTGASDTDWWSFQAEAGKKVSVFCASLRNGSGVFNMNVSLFFNPAGAPLQSDTETETTDLAWHGGDMATRPPVSITSTGTYYLAVGANLFSSDVTGRNYNCGVHVN